MQHPTIGEHERAELEPDHCRCRRLASADACANCSAALPVWAIIVGHFCTNWGGYVLLAWMPTYITKGLGVDFASVGIFAVIPSLCSFLFLNVAGWLADRLIKRGWDVTTARKTMQTIGFGGAATTLMFVGYIHDAPAAIALMSVGSILGACAAGGFGVNHLDVAPRYAGVLMGLSNTAGTIPGIIGVYVSGLILELDAFVDAGVPGRRGHLPVRHGVLPDLREQQTAVRLTPLRPIVTRGNVTVNSAPGSQLRTSTLPPIAVVSSETSARPMPVPVVSRVNSSSAR